MLKITFRADRFNFVRFSGLNQTAHHTSPNRCHFFNYQKSSSSFASPSPTEILRGLFSSIFPPFFCWSADLVKSPPKCLFSFGGFSWISSSESRPNNFLAGLVLWTSTGGSNSLSSLNESSSLLSSLWISSLLILSSSLSRFKCSIGSRDLLLKGKMGASFDLLRSNGGRALLKETDPAWRLKPGRAIGSSRGLGLLAGIPGMLVKVSGLPVKFPGWINVG